jgi:hypothetical protein
VKLTPRRPLMHVDPALLTIASMPVFVLRIAEMEEFWTFMKKSRATLAPGSFET